MGEHVFDMRDGASGQKCYRCGEFKAAEDFSWRRRARNQRDGFCRPCRAAYKQEHYQANKQRYIDRANAKRKDLFRSTLPKHSPPATGRASSMK